MAKKEKVVNLIEKIDKKKKEIKQLKKDLQKHLMSFLATGKKSLLYNFHNYLPAI